MTELNEIEQLESLGEQILTGISGLEIDHTLVERIWDLEPKDLTKNLRAVIIEKLRRDRALFKEKTKTRAAKKKISAPSTLNFDDLDLG